MLFVSQEGWLIGLLLALVATLVWLESKKGGERLSYHEVTRLLNDGSGVLLDLRDRSDFQAGHIVDSVNIPYASLANEIDKVEPHRKKTIIVADKMGQHAGAAGKILKDNGFTVTRLQGGITEWSGQNLPLVRS